MDEMTLREGINQQGLKEMRDLLRNYKARTGQTLSPKCWQKLSDIKEKAVSSGDQLTAKAVWCLETIGHIQDHFVSVFLQLRAGEYEEAWNLLERCENEIAFLDRHFTEEGNEFGVEHARVRTKQLQDLYPLTLAFSPALLLKEVRCSICDTKLTLRSRCDHVSSEIYDGEMCGRVVTSAELLHLALVTNPVQKFSFIFPEGGNDRPFRPIKELAIAIGSPWRRWSYYREERRQFHPDFKGIGRNERCPCSSGAKYKCCCLGKEKVYPHFVISF